MRRMFLVSAFALVSSSSCVAGGLQSGSDCRSYHFEDDVKIDVQEKFVKTLNMLLEHRAPEVITSMRLELHGIDEIQLPVSIEEVHISSFFRPLEPDQTKCQLVEGKESSRCYVSVPEHPLQVAAVFQIEDGQEVAFIMEQLGAWVSRTALDCE
jgi:hypothetical protein